MEKNNANFLLIFLVIQNAIRSNTNHPMQHALTLITPCNTIRSNTNHPMQYAVTLITPCNTQ